MMLTMMFTDACFHINVTVTLVLWNFITMFKKANLENAKLAELEKKKAAKAKELEKNRIAKENATKEVLADEGKDETLHNLSDAAKQLQKLQSSNSFRLPKSKDNSDFENGASKDVKPVVQPKKEGSFIDVPKKGKLEKKLKPRERPSDKGLWK